MKSYDLKIAIFAACTSFDILRYLWNSSVIAFIKHAIIFAMNGILPEFITYFSPRNAISYDIGIVHEKWVGNF